MPTVRDCMSVVQAHHNLTPHDLMSRRLDTAQQRQQAMWLARHCTPASLPTIARTMGRDHSTVHHGIRAHRKRMAENAAVAAETRRLVDMLEGRQ